MERPIGDPGSGVVVADSSKASLLSSRSCRFCFFFVLGLPTLPLGLGVTSTDAAAASDAAAAAANTESFFLGTLVRIERPILLLLLLLILLLLLLLLLLWLDLHLL
jgi:hypothetical protein